MFQALEIALWLLCRRT